MIRFHELPACRRYYQAPALLNATGYIPMFLSEDDDRSAREQFAGNYIGGWEPFNRFELRFVGPAATSDNRNIPSLKFTDDPLLPPLAYAQLRDELIVVYPYSWVMVMQPDNSYEVTRMD